MVAQVFNLCTFFRGFHEALRFNPPFPYRDWGACAAYCRPVRLLLQYGWMLLGFTRMIENYSNKRAPLRHNITHEEAAHGALFLLSPLAGGITGRVLAVDAGYSIMGA